MAQKHIDRQLTLFDSEHNNEIYKNIVLYALGEFQSRGFKLTDRKLPLDRLRGAFKRAAEHYKHEELPDDLLAETLTSIGANVEKVPSYVARHPYRITINKKTSTKASNFFEKVTTKTT